METKKEFTPMDFLTVTQAGNIVVTDPVTGNEFLCFRQKDNTFIHSISKEVLTVEEIGRAVMQRIAIAKQVDELHEAKAHAQKPMTVAPPPLQQQQQQLQQQQLQQQQQPKFCIHCGAQLIPGDKFCIRCGKAL